MEPSFFAQPILNSPYSYPGRHWELDPNGQPTNQIVPRRRFAEYITPIPKPKKRRQAAIQQEIVFNEGKGLSTADQQYDPTPMINLLRQKVDQWREISNPSDWHVTPETGRLLQHWRHHKFSDTRPFFCEVEATETAIWLTEVAPTLGKDGRDLLDYLDRANQWANPGMFRPARKHAGQYRKDKQTPYIAHPFRVAMTVRHTFGSDDRVALAAALLHDVIEDTTADYDDLEKEFGREVADVVAALTKDMRMQEKAREDAYDVQLTAAPWQARLVKLADVYDNLVDCLDDSMRTKAIVKAERAIECAGAEPLLQRAIREVHLLIGR